jgi:hypothetical protein
VDSGDRCGFPGPSGPCYPIAQQQPGGGFVVGYNTLGFLNDPSFGTCYQVGYLTATTPSCTIMTLLEPDQPGPNNGFVAPDYYDVLGANVTGIGLLSRKSIYCRKKHGKFVSHKKITRYCVNR